MLGTLGAPASVSGFGVGVGVGDDIVGVGTGVGATLLDAGVGVCIVVGCGVTGFGTVATGAVVMVATGALVDCTGPGGTVAPTVELLVALGSINGPPPVPIVDPPPEHEPALRALTAVRSTKVDV
ncbi:MAG TPA: hypothetical protein VHM70_16680 [Polyangiaceae bacterium]|jgi:hypothetical protein|nr:hypothetical protein [Polyangiaceae bacterium]